MIRVIYVGSYDCEPKYIVRVNSLVQHEYAEQPFIAMLCKPYIDYDTIQADDGLQRPGYAAQRFRPPVGLSDGRRII